VHCIFIFIKKKVRLLDYLFGFFLLLFLRFLV